VTALTVSEVLAKAADLIEPEGAWSNDDVARDRAGEMTFAADPSAVCWCALGAIWHASVGTGVNDYLIENAVLRIIEGDSIAAWNDAPGRTQAEVVAALRAASAKAGEA
jgi:hypothetical protein